MSARLTWGEATHAGKVRERNEDLTAVALDFRLFAVLDGMGGHDGGAEAARAGARGLVDGYWSATRLGRTKALGNAFALANTRVQEIWQDFPRSGATCTALAFSPGLERATLAWVGDSPAFVLSEVGGFRQLTTPHKAGRFVTRALGHDGHIPSLLELRRKSTARFLLCSDGVTDELSAEEIETVLRTEGADAGDVARQLVHLAVDVGSGSDNATAIVVDVG